MFTLIQDIGTGAAPQVQLGNINFALSQVAGYADFTALFDEYRINWVKLTFTPPVTRAASTVGAGTNVNPSYPFYTVLDYNEVNAPANLTELGQYSSCVTHDMNGKPFSVFIRPHILGMVYQSAIATSYVSLPPRQWIANNYSAVPHYGLKYGFMGTNIAVAPIDVLNITAEWSVSCKYSR